jgi:hypothetical protein
MARGGRVRVYFDGDAKSLERATGKAEKSIGKLGTATNRLGKDLGGARKHLLGFAAGFGTLAGAASFIKGSVKVTEELAVGTKKLASLTGLSEKEASRWVSTAKVRNVESKALNIGFITLARNIRSATEGGDQQIKMFRELGVSQAELKKGDITQVLLDTSDAFQKLGGGSERTAIAQKLFGRQAQTLLPLLKEGSGALKEQLLLSDKYGTTLSKNQVQKGLEALKAQRELNLAMTGLKVTVGQALLPGLTKGAQGLSNFTNEIRRTLGQDLTTDEKISKIGDLIERRIGDATPAIANAAGKIAPKVALGFVRGFSNANVWGKLAAGTFLISRLVGWRSIFRALAGRMATTFAATFAAETAAESGAASLLGRFRSRLPAGRVRALGAVAGRAFALGFLTLGGIELYNALKDKIPGQTGSAGPRYKGPTTTNPEAFLGQLKSQGYTDLQFDQSGKYVTGKSPSGKKIKRRIPGRAKGGMAKGWTVVGEEGPELAHFSQPAEIVSHPISKKMVQGLTGKVPGFAGGTLSYAQLVSLARRVGFPNPALAAAVAEAESGGNIAAHGDRNLGGSYGLWQIHHPSHPSYDIRRLASDPTYNARAALAISGHGRTWAPWTTYRTGAYKQYLGSGKGAPLPKGLGGGGVGTGAVDDREQRLQARAERLAGLVGGTLQERLEGRLGVAGLTSTLSDDLKILGTLESALKSKLTRQKKSGFFAAAGTTAQSLKDVRSQISDLRSRRKTQRQKQRGVRPEGGLESLGPFGPKGSLVGASLANIDKDLALAGLTEDTGDDLSVLQRKQSVLGSILTLAKQKGDPTLIADAASQLKDTIDAINSLKESVDSNSSKLEEQSAKLQAQLDLQNQQLQETRQRLNTSQTQYAVLAQAIAAVVSGEIGGKVGLGQQSISFAGGSARY